MIERAIHTQPTTNNLIIGAGLAGCSMGWRLQQAGQAFKIVGSSRRPSAAKVAAGIINPITGRWMTKSWRFDDFASEAEDFYRSLEKAFSIEVYHPIPAVRFCLNAEDAKRARRRCRNPRYAKVLNQDLEPVAEHPLFNNPHGSFSIRGAAYVDLMCAIKALRAHFKSDGRYCDADFNHSELKKSESGWTYQSEHFDRVIFCEGAALKDNPWFGHLPLTPAKGETLLCRCDKLPLDEELYHQDKWLLPYPDGSFRIGATYDESDLSPEPTEAARETLTKAFHAMTRKPYALEILDQPAGIRPSTSDARPLLGAHPTEAGLYLFNGLGSKGASLAPTLSRELLDYIFETNPLDAETDIARFVNA
ncbi:MAG: NAD(P)/FAD-dependent oxidoreductase [Opitutales bacterium]